MRTAADSRFSRRPEDPLAELARLIGQDDPFAEFNNDSRQPARSLATPLPRRAVNGNANGNGAASSYSRPAPRNDRYENYREPADDQYEYDRAPDHYARQYEDAGYGYSLPAKRAPITPANGKAYSYGGGQTLRAEPQVTRQRPVAPRVEPQPQPEDEYDYAETYTEPQQPQYGYQNGNGHAPYDASYDASYRQARAPQAPAQYQEEHYEQEYAQDYQQGYEAEYAQDQYEYEQEYAEPRSSKRWLMLGATALIGVLVLGVGGVYGYRALFKHHRTAEEPPTIRSAETPTKVVPTAQASLDGTKQNYDRIGDQPPAGGERVVSREEQPAKFDAMANQINRVVAPTPGNGVSAFAAPAAPNPADIAAQPAPGNGEPKRVRTMSVRSDGSVVDQPRRAQPAVAPQSSRNAPLALSPNAQADQSQDDPDAQAAISQPARTPVRTAGPVQTAQPWAGTEPARQQTSNYVPAGSYVVQVSSQKNEADAQTAWRQLQAKYTNVLGNAQVTFKRVDLGDRGTFYRAMVGPFGNRDQAYEMCQNLKSAGGECVVQRN